MNGRSIRLICAALLLTGCEPAEDVRIQDLPPLDRPSPEARAGLPEVEGAWRFAGWELAPGDTGRLASELPGLGQILLETQRLDSLAGYYLAGQGRLPLVGEVRRDSAIALAALLGGAEGRYLAGRVLRDTLWVSTTSLLEPGIWPDEARAAFVRTRVAAPFVRVQGAPVLTAVTDTAAAPLAAMDSVPRAPTAGTGMGAPARPAPAAQTRPPVSTPAQTPAQAPARQQPPAQAQPQPQRPPAPSPPARREPPPEPAPTPPAPRLPPLLGEPVRGDTARDTTGPRDAYSPSAVRATARPRSVSSSR